MKDSEHLQWIHDRIINIYNESENVDFLIRLRDIIKTMKESEDGFEKYMKFIADMKFIKGNAESGDYCPRCKSNNLDHIDDRHSKCCESGFIFVS